MSQPVAAALSARGCVAQIAPYVPGRPVEEVMREYGINDVIKLASNENPLGVSPRAKQAIIAAADGVNIYPDGSGRALKQALSDHYGIAPEQITLGNGSNDILEIIARAYLQPGVAAVYSQYGFAIYKLATQAAGAEHIEVPARPEDDALMPFGADLNAMAAAVTADTRVIFLANPNNPTGTWVNCDELIGFLDAIDPRVVVVLDEAYTEYVEDADFPDGMALLERYPNLIVTRTFSKIYGLAGLRVGFAVSHPDLADLLNRVRQPFNVNNVASAAAIAALDDADFVAKSIEVNRAGLAQWHQAVSKNQWQAVPSRGNFITLKTPYAAATVFEELLRHGVIVRPLGGNQALGGLSQAVRISIGTFAENERAIDAFSAVMAKLRSA
ncbi:MAG TPA: histidinol-phosphate transaminase [Halothiobacillaceae bacterium]|nr:histidinol-phosphate transaminase [Halothiobacillaceae bacterium]